MSKVNFDESLANYSRRKLEENNSWNPKALAIEKIWGQEQLLRVLNQRDSMLIILQISYEMYSRVNDNMNNIFMLQR